MHSFRPLCIVPLSVAVGMVAFGVFEVSFAQVFDGPVEYVDGVIGYVFVIHDDGKLFGYLRVGCSELLAGYFEYFNGWIGIAGVRDFVGVSTISEFKASGYFYDLSFQ